METDTETEDGDHNENENENILSLKRKMSRTMYEYPRRLRRCCFVAQSDRDDLEKSSTQQRSGVFYQLLVFVFVFVFVFLLFIFILFFSSSTNTFTIAPCSAEIGVSIVRHMGNVSYITLMGQAILALAVRPECAGSPAKGLEGIMVGKLSNKRMRDQRTGVG